jgi:8-oxo-dGTP diphosphatase
MSKLQVSILIPIRDKKVLALKRSESSSWGGYWNFPGGKVDSGEFVSGAAVRELYEETGLSVEEDDASFFGISETYDKIFYFFITTKAENDVKINKESSDYMWIDINDIDKYKFLSVNKSMISGLTQFINDIGKD